MAREERRGRGKGGQRGGESDGVLSKLGGCNDPGRGRTFVAVQDERDEVEGEEVEAAGGGKRRDVRRRRGWQAEGSEDGGGREPGIEEEGAGVGKKRAVVHSDLGLT